MVKKDSPFAWEMQLAINLYSAGNTWFNIDTVSLDSLSGIVQYNSPAGYMAGGICALLGKSPVTWPMPLIDSAMVHSADSALNAEGIGDRKSNGTGNGTPPITNVNNTGPSSFSVFPNPTYGMLTTSTTGNGTFIIYTIEGQQIGEYAIGAGYTNITLPLSLAPGLYMGVFKPDTGGNQTTVRLVYQP